GQRAPGTSSTRLGATEVRQLPGVFGDPFRSIEVLPGVVPAASGVPFYFIRGSPPGNTGYFVDGIPVPALFHLAVGPSIIHPARATDALGDKDTVGVFALGSYDTLAQRQGDGHFAEQLGFTFHRVDLRLDHRLGEEGHLRAAVTVGIDRSGQEGLDFTKQLG